MAIASPLLETVTFSTAHFHFCAVFAMIVCFLQSGNCWRWSATTWRRNWSYSSPFVSFQFKSLIRAIPRSVLSLTTVTCFTAWNAALKESSSYHSTGSLARKSSESPNSWNNLFELTVQNCSRPLSPKKAGDSTQGHFGGWFGADSPMAATINFFDPIGMQASNNVKPMNSSDGYHTCRPSFFVVAEEMAGWWYLSKIKSKNSWLISLKLFRGASTVTGAVIQALRWIRTAKTAMSQMPLSSHFVILNWFRNRHILMT